MYCFVARPSMLRLVVFIATVLMLAHGNEARADYATQSFTLSLSNTYGTSNYGTVTVNAYDGHGGNTGGLSAGEVQFMVTINSTISGLGSGFAMNMFGFNTNLSVQSSNSSGANYLASPIPSNPPSWSIGIGNQQMDGFGNFSVEYQASGQDHWLGSGEFDVFNLNTTGKTSTDLLNEFLFKSTSNTQPAVYFAAHVANDSKSHYVGSGSGDDGGGGGLLTPEPATLTMTLIGFAGVGLTQGLRRLRRQRLQLA